jgi:predicted glutamine amidotransferase
MCIAIYKPAKLEIPENHLKNSWAENSDGAGFAFIKNGKVAIRKGYLNWDEFLQGYKNHFKHNKDSPFLIHFRIRSLGDKDISNTHPFQFPGGALIHNGTIGGTRAQNLSGKSDTALFTEHFADKFKYETLLKNKQAIEDALSFNKVAFLFDSGKYLIMNEASGHWRNDIWYSNYTYSDNHARQLYPGMAGWERSY